MTVEAPAKVNLALHVTGRRADGYHCLDSWVAFTELGDRLRLDDAEADSLDCTGPFAGDVPPGADNHVFRALALFRQAFPEAPSARRFYRITLDKHLPVASGLGGGTGNGAAMLRALAHLGGIDLDAPELAALALKIGADGPMCLKSRSARAEGIGEVLTPFSLPELDLVLVNPGVAVETPPVFRALRCRENPPLAAFDPDEDCIGQLAGARNDLCEPAMSVAPEIGTVLGALQAAPGVRLARMSGSGATCFAIVQKESAAKDLAARLKFEHPDWWVEATRTRSGG